MKSIRSSFFWVLTISLVVSLSLQNQDVPKDSSNAKKEAKTIGGKVKSQLSKLNPFGPKKSKKSSQTQPSDTNEPSGTEETPKKKENKLVSSLKNFKVTLTKNDYKAKIDSKLATCVEGAVNMGVAIGILVATHLT